ncbi:MAG TPA: methyltransferase [Casimicrobiaceae bacterium]|nr:methyltransferase [Casimicrobiaceae bacterium]
MQIPPSMRMWQLATGHFLPRCLHVVAELGVADHLSEQAMTAEALASATGADAGAVGRMLRLLATAGIFAPSDGAWVHTELSRLLRSDHPQSMRAFVRMIGGRLQWASIGELEHTARSGQAAVEKLVPGGMWAYFGEHPDEGRIFDAAMTAKSSAEIAALLPSFDFSSYRVIADIAGGRGHILDAVLAATPDARGILFDRPAVVAGVAARPRLSAQGGDFFSDPLPTADAYLLSNVLHDWNDAKAAAILRSIRRAAPPRADLLVLESILPEGAAPHPAKVLDIVMLGLTGGRERMQHEYQALFEAGGFRLDRVVPTQGPISVLVGKPA